MIIVRAISDDKRADIISAKQRNESVVEIKKWLNVSDSTISRVWNKFLKTGSYLPIPYTGRRSDITPEQKESIKAKIFANPDITIENLIDELNLNLTQSGVSRLLFRMDFSLKKRRSILADKNAWMSHKRGKSGKEIKKI